MLCALLVTLALLAFVCWGWAYERKIRMGLVTALDIERQAYRMLVELFNSRNVSVSLKHPTVRFEKDFIREQARHTTTRLVLPAEAPERKRTPRH